MAEENNVTKVIPKYAVVCDDIRREDNGKHILIGVYTGSIVVTTFPANVNLSFWIHFEITQAGKADIEVRGLLDPGNLEIFKIGTQVEAKAAGPFSVLSFGGIGAALHQEGKLSLQMREIGGEWQEINQTLVELKRST